MSGKILQNTFKAWIDNMPGSQDPLIVTGDVVFPTGGWKAELVEAVPQGINPTILILDERETAPTGIVNQMVTTLHLRFEKPHGKAYKQVTIRGAGSQFTIPVAQVN